MIGLFLAFCEVTVGLAATQAEGWIQGMLAVFSVGFPVGVASVFFTFLWKRPWVLYAPRDYATDTSVEAYVDALSSNRIRQGQRVEAAIEEVLETILQGALPPVRERIDYDNLFQNLTDAISDEIAGSTISIRLDRFDPKLPSEPLEFVADPDMVVADLLDYTYFAIDAHVRPFAYGKEWVLEDESTGKKYVDMGTIWANSHGSGDRDARPLREVGLRPGQRLVVVRP